MRADTRLAFAAYLLNQERLNGAPAGAAFSGYAVSPSVQQKLESKIQESAEFLTAVNIVPVTELKGQKLRLGVTGPIASRVDTSAAGSTGRQTRDPGGLEPQNYECVKINYDTHINYSTLDTWAKFPDFQARLRAQTVRQQALDRITIGFNGTHAAPTTDVTANPLLQDVARGWLEAIREDAPQRAMEHGALDTAKIYVDGPGHDAGHADYANLDALVYDMVMLLDPWAREDTRLRVVLGRGLMHDKYLPILNTNQKPIDVLAGQTIVAQRRVGGFPAVTVPFFPENGILLTTLENLSVYYQEGARRSLTEDRPKFDRVETFESSNDAYVVENYGYSAFAENIQMGPKAQ